MRSGHVVAVGAVVAGGLAAAIGAYAACSGSSSSASRPEAGSDAAPAERGAAAAAVIEVPAPGPLGASSLDEFGYRRGPGRGPYDRAVKAEKNAREDADWEAVVTACRAALDADPAHLDASWLLAAALARLGKHDQILAPLSQAVAGDWGKWGERSLTLPLFGDFLASPHGTAYQQLAEQYRAAFAQATQDAVIVLGRDGQVSGRGRDRGKQLGRRTEVYGWSGRAARWLRLSRTGGTVVAALPLAGGGLVAYVAYRDLSKAGDRKGALARPRIAVIDLLNGRVSREIAFADVRELTVGWKAGKAGAEPSLVVEIEGGKDDGTWALDWKRGHKKRPASGQTLAVGRDALAVARGQVRRLRLPVADITADWDDDGLASAIRLEASRKTVIPPAGLMVDGHGLVWSPDRARLALVALPEGDCSAPATLFVVDAGTGKLREVGGAAAPAPVWIDAAHLAYTAGDRVLIVDVTSAQVDRELTSSGGVATAIVDRSCADAENETLFAPAPGDIEEPIDEPTADGAAPSDADAGVEPTPTSPPTSVDAGASTR